MAKIIKQDYEHVLLYYGVFLLIYSSYNTQITTKI